MKNHISFTEVRMDSNIDQTAHIDFSELKYPIHGKIFKGAGIKNPFSSKGVIYESVDKLVSVETALSFISSLKNDESKTTFFLSKYFGTPILIRVLGKTKEEPLSLSFYRLYENGFYTEDMLILPLQSEGSKNNEVLFNLLMVESFPDKPDESYEEYVFHKQALTGTLHLSHDKKVMFHKTNESGYKRVWANQLPDSVKRFFTGRTKKGVLSQAVVADKMVYLLENGLVFNGTGYIKKENVSKETYEYLVFLAEIGYKGNNIHKEISPCLFFE